MVKQAYLLILIIYKKEKYKIFGTRKKLKIAMENQKLLYKELEERKKLDIRRQEKIRELKEIISKEANNNVELNQKILILEDEKMKDKKEIANLKRLCSRNGINYKKKGNK